MKQKLKQTQHSGNDDFFKQCTVCKALWKTRDDMLADPEIHIIGYQSHFEDLTLGLFLFNHICHGTFSIRAEEFLDMYNGPTFLNNLSETKECPGYCRHQKSLEPCPLQCECGYIREIVQLVKKHPVGSHKIPEKD